MSVKKKDRHLSRSECLNRARKLVQQVMILTRPLIQNEDGTQTKPGILGAGQPYYAFGIDLFNSAKAVHSYCYQGVEIYIKDQETLNSRNEYFKKAIQYCDSMMRLLDLCIFQYARTNKRKMRSFVYVASLIKDVKDCLYQRMNLDNMILQNIQEKKMKRTIKLQNG